MFEEQSSLDSQQEMLMANAALQRGKSPRGPNPEKCRSLLHDIQAYLKGGVLEVAGEDIGKNVTRGLIERYGQMTKDNWRLYEAGTAGIPGIGSWNGHQKIYDKMRENLKKLLKNWDDGNCNDWDGLKGASPDQIAKIIGLAREWVKQDPPVAPDRILQQQKENGWQWPSFELPKIEIPDWIWIVPRILLGDPQRAELGQPDSPIALQELPENSTLESLNPGLYEALNRITSDTTNQSDPTQEVTVQSLNPGLYEALESITSYTALQNTYLAQLQESREQQVNKTEQQVVQTRPQLEYD
jgi:hypothetical protein